jgi:polysaccharide biosynthesis protein PslH
MTRRRVLWVSHLIPYPPSAGVLLRAYNLVKAVAARHDLSLVAFIQNFWLETCFGSYSKGMTACREALEPLCSSVEFLPIESSNRPAGQVRTALEGLVLPAGYMERWLQGTEAHRAFSRLAAGQRFDVAHFDTISLAPFRRYFRDTPATLGHHNIESHMLLRRAENSANLLKRAYFWQEGKRLERYESRIGRFFDWHITCSDLDGERLRQINPSFRTRTIPNGVDCEFFCPAGLAQKPAALIFVGTMNWYPNVDAVLFLLREIWDGLAARHPGITLDIVGANPPEEVREAAKGRSGVTVHGFVNDVRPMIESATLFVCPIRDGGGTKLKILDACSMQKCIVAHPVACEGIDVTPGVNVQFATGSAEWVQGITGLLADSERRLQMGRAARELVTARYSFDAIGQQLAELFDQTVQDRAATPSSSR